MCLKYIHTVTKQVNSSWLLSENVTYPPSHLHAVKEIVTCFVNQTVEMELEKVNLHNLIVD